MYYADGFESEEEGEDIDEIACYHLPRPNKVREKLFIGCQDSARNKLSLKMNKISHILNLTGGKPVFRDDFTYYIVEKLDDTPFQDLLSHIPACISFIEKGIQEGTGVLVHCAAGVSRSCSIVMAYLMKSERISQTEALSIVKTARPIVSPNCGFKKQLGMWEEMHYILEGTNKAHRLYHLQKCSREFNQYGKIPNIKPEEDPQNIHIIDSDFVFSCKQCQRELFLESNSIEHIKGLSLYGKNWCEDGDCEFVYLEPISWMGDITKASCGDLNCPKCGIILGSWTWSSSRCSCSTMVSPSFKVSLDCVNKRREGRRELALNSFS